MQKILMKTNLKTLINSLWTSLEGSTIMAPGQKKKCDLKSKSSTLPSNIPTTQVQPKSVALPTKIHAIKSHSKSMLRNSTSCSTVEIQNFPLNDEVAVNMPPTSINIFAPPRTNRSTSSSTPNVIRSTPTSPNDLETLKETIDEASITKKRSRSVARGFEVKKRMKEGKKLGGVFIKKSMHLPFGLAEKLFKMEIGIVTRLLAPLRVFY